MITWTKETPTRAGWYWVKATWVGDEYPRELPYVVFVSPSFNGLEVTYFAGRETMEEFARDATAWSLWPIEPDPVTDTWNQAIQPQNGILKTYYAVCCEPERRFTLEENMETQLEIYSSDVTAGILASEWQQENSFNCGMVPVNIVPHDIMQPLLESAKSVSGEGSCDCEPDITDPCSYCILRATLNTLLLVEKPA